MGPLIITILLGLASSSTQKSVKSNDVPQEPPELEAYLENLITNSLSKYYKDGNFKIDVNKNRKRSEDFNKVQYLGELSSEKDPSGFQNLNKKLAKLLDGLQQHVMNEDTKDSTCSCDYANKRWPGVLKCECGSSAKVGDDTDRRDDSREAERPDLKEKNIDYQHDNDRLNEKRLHQKHEDRREDRSDEDELDEFRQVARFNKGDREDGYWSDDNYCSCKLLRSTGHENSIKYLRCGCGSPGRLGDNRESDRDQGYWTEDTSCGCKLLRNKDDDNDFSHYLKCGCNSPTRVGYDREDDSEGYGSGDNRCGCQLLRNTDDDKNVYYLRCRCNSPGRVGDKADSNNDIRDQGDRDDGYWSDDNHCNCKLLRSKGDTNSIKYLRCGCGSPGRLGDKREIDRDQDYWTEDTSCGCKLLRNKDDDNDFSHYLKCGCNSPTRVGYDREDDSEGYGSGDNRCGCQLLRNKDDDKNVHYLRCRCNSPGRVGNKADSNNDRDEGDRDDGYWSDDNDCNCKLLRSKGDTNTIKYLRCGCGSPGRLGEIDRDESYWMDDTSCGCELLRHMSDEKGVKNLRCRCNSPIRAGRGKYIRVSYDNDDADKEHYGSKTLERNIDEQKINTLINYILTKDKNIDQSHLSSKKKKVLLKLKNIMPSLRNIETYKLQAKLASILNAIDYPLRQKKYNQSNRENPLTEKKIQRLLKLIQQQKKTSMDNKQMYRRSMSEDSIGVPFTYQLQGLAQVNT